MQSNNSGSTNPIESESLLFSTLFLFFPTTKFFFLVYVMQFGGEQKSQFPPHSFCLLQNGKRLCEQQQRHGQKQKQLPDLLLI